MDAPLDDYVQFLLRAGVPVDGFAGLTREPDHDEALIPPAATSPRTLAFDHDLKVVEHLDVGAGLGADHATRSVARAILHNESTLRGAGADIGCGTGLLAVLLAKLGASPVVGTDVDEQALVLAHQTALANRVDLDLRLGSLCEPLPPMERFEVCVANLPHKPALAGDPLPIAQHGGPEGDGLFAQAIPCLFQRQAPGARFYFFLHSLPHPRLLALVARHYAIRPVSWKLRYFGLEEYPQMRESFRKRHRDATSFIATVGEREALVACIWRGVRRVEPLP
ncbi:MAG: 50S ribosomal protein L11 methyltransferase [Planctomycetes bacterium]|nr:50S ribosomal protein L11 methyltransferase [Planctomycetota bacterium]